MRPLILAVGCLGLLLPPLQAQDAGKVAADTPHVTIATSVGAGARASSPAGKRALLVDVSPKARMHVYAPGEKEGISVTLTIDQHPAIKVAPAVFPPPEKYYFEPLKLIQLVFSKPFRITQPVSFSGAAAVTPLTIRGSLRYQACDDTVCYLPRTVRLSWTIGP